MEQFEKHQTYFLLKTVRKFTTSALFIFLLADCNKSDDPTPTPIQIGETSIVSSQPKTCNSGPGYSYQLKTNFNAEAGINVQKLVLKYFLSNGSTQEAEFKGTQLENNGTDVRWAACIGFGSSSKIETEIRLVGEKGEISNVTRFTFTKP
jgi:hypothetical protein